jgi:hypothetical protein
LHSKEETAKQVTGNKKATGDDDLSADALKRLEESGLKQ